MTSPLSATGRDASGMTGTTQPLIRLEGIKKVFLTDEVETHALSEVHLEIRAGEYVAIAGPSGCGKTTLLKVLSGVLAPTSGSVSFDGKVVQRQNVVGQVGYVFQRPLLLPWRTALENVLLTLEVARKEMSRADRLAEAHRWLEITGLKGFENRYPNELSGGMQQRVSISRALAFRPQLLLMDEPFAALDEITRETLQEELLELWSKVETTVVFITHSIPEAVLLSERIVVMSARPGRVVEEIEVPFARPRSEETRALPSFSELAGHIRHLLRGNPAHAKAEALA
jgi:NitT/TauT family transport system ATP-binding protein